MHKTMMVSWARACSAAVVSVSLIAGVSHAQDLTLSYDELGRLVTAYYSNNNKEVRYEFDAAGNRESVVVTTTSAPPNGPPSSGVILVMPISGISLIPL